MKIFGKFLKFSFLLVALSSGFVFVDRPAFADYSHGKDAFKLENCRNNFNKYCKNCSEQTGVIRFNLSDHVDATLWFSPAFVSEKFGIDKKNFFKNIGCEIESKTGAKYRIRPFFDEFGNNAINLDADGDCAQVRICYDYNAMQLTSSGAKVVPSAEDLDSSHTGTGEFKFDFGFDEGFKLVEGETYKVRLFKVDKMQIGGEWVDFDSNLVQGRGASLFKPQDVVAEFEAKAELRGPDESLWHILTDETKSKFGVFSKFKHLENFDEDYALSLIDFHEFIVQNRSESRGIARKEA